MRKTAALLLSLCLLCMIPATALAAPVTQDDTGGSAEISVTVPDSHTLTVQAEHAQVFIESREADSFEVSRLSAPRLLIRPENGYRVTKVTLNGVDVTAQVKAGYYTLEPVYEEKTLIVETEKAPTDPDSGRDIGGTVRDEDGNPVPGAEVDIGGKTGITDEDGNFKIEDVPDGRHPVTITDGDGNIIGYTEVEIGGGDSADVAEDSGGGYTITAPEHTGLDMVLTVTADGRITADQLTGVQAPSGGGSAETGDSSQMALWLTLLLASGAALAGTAAFLRQKKSL